LIFSSVVAVSGKLDRRNVPCYDGFRELPKRLRGLSGRKASTIQRVSMSAASIISTPACRSRFASTVSILRLAGAALPTCHFQLPCVTQGISPFSSAGDGVSQYRRDVDYYDDTLRNFAHFSLPAPNLLKAYSTDKVSAGHFVCAKVDRAHDGKGRIRVFRKLCGSGNLV